MKKLLAVTVSEMGWELFCFQGILRAMSKKYDQVTVASREGHDLLYQDFICNFVPLRNVGTQTTGMRCLDYKEDDSYKKFIDKDTRVIKPEEYLVSYNPSSPGSWRKVNQRFIAYGKELDTHIDFLIHPRMTNKCGSGERNWAKDKWD